MSKPTDTRDNPNPTDASAQPSVAAAGETNNGASPARTFLVMKVAAALLMTIVFATLLYNSKLHNLFFASTERTRIPNLGPAALRPAALTLPAEAQLAYPGYVTHIVFWAEWCEPCRRELPLIDQLAQAYGPQNFQVVLINVDSPQSLEQARNLQLALAPNISNTLYEDTAELKAKFNVSALPYHVLVDKQGRTATAFYTDISKHTEPFKSLLLQLLAE